jgi:serine/threonine protein phosphatase PrpC
VTADTPAARSRPCPSCGEPVWPDDNFCEACRAPLIPAAAPATPAAPDPAAGQARPDTAGPPAVPAAAAAAPGSENGRQASCQSCGSGPISADGYCEACGRKAPSPRDHIETDLGLLAGVTDRGLRHYRNEDAMALSAVQAAGGAIAIAVVCDGVSGSSRPDEASNAATEAAMAVLVPAARDGQDTAIASLQAVQAAQEAVAGLADATGSAATQDAPSATFVSAVVSAQSVTVCWLGDSRAYWLDAGQTAAARQLTTDDSVAAQMVTAGLLSEAAALDSPQAHVVTGWLGADVSDTAPHVATFEPPGPGVVLVCSDGLWNYQPDAAGLAARALPVALSKPLDAARTLVGFALKAGGHDNVTVVIAPFPPTRPDPPRAALRAAEEMPPDDPVPNPAETPAQNPAPTDGQGDDDE